MRAVNGKISCHHIQGREGPYIVYNRDNVVMEAFRRVPEITLLNGRKLNI